MRARLLTALLAGTVAAATLSGCSSSKDTSAEPSADGHKTIAVVATINAWGSIATQLGGDRIHEVSIITNPDTDPHSYEPTASNARAVADARIVIENGIGYDDWADKLLSSNPNSGRTVVSAQQVTGVADGGNPHQWYSPESVGKMIDAITAAYQKADPDSSAYFQQQHDNFVNQGLRQYHSLITEIRTKYAGTPVGASESIFTPLSDALGLNLLTPAAFLKAISEGTDPSPADKATIDRQIATKQIQVYVFNSQNSTPDIAAQVEAAKKQGIPVTTVTETLAPKNASFQDWQVDQLKNLAQALHTATGK